MVATLEDLVIDVPAIDRALLAGTLAPYVRLSETGALVPLAPGWATLSTERAVVVCLLAFRAAAALGLRADGAAAPAEITRATGLPGGSVRPALVRLLRARRIVRIPHAGRFPLYFVPLAALSVLRTWLGAPDSTVLDAIDLSAQDTPYGDHPAERQRV